MQASMTTNSRLIARRAAPSLSDALGLGGALAGIGGGLAMWSVSALLAQALGMDIWFQFKAIASIALGASAMAQTGFVAGAVLTGLLIHLAAAALLGALFEILMRRVARLPSDLGVPELTGLTYGMLIWLAVYFVIAPALSPLLLQIYAPALIIQHIVYGAITGLLYAMLRPRPYAIAG